MNANELVKFAIGYLAGKLDWQFKEGMKGAKVDMSSNEDVIVYLLNRAYDAGYEDALEE